MHDKCRGSFVFVLEDRGWNGGAAPGRLFSAARWKAGRSASLPREPSGGRKRQGSKKNLVLCLKVRVNHLCTVKIVLEEPPAECFHAS